MPASQKKLERNTKRPRTKESLFIKLCELERICLTGEMIMERAKEVANDIHVPHNHRPGIGWPWLRHLNACHGIRWKRAQRMVDSVKLTAGETRLQRQQRDVIHLYEPCDVFNMDESAFFYNKVL